MSMDQIEQDQEDFYERILADPYFATIGVFAEHKGVTQSEIDRALSTLNARGGKTGACVIVLMARLVGDTPNAPGPRSKISIDVQVIDMPVINLGASGTGKSCSQIAEQVRMLNHLFRNGNGTTYTFDSQEPVKIKDGQNCFVVTFTRLAGDNPSPKVAAPLIAPNGGVSPQSVTLTCATPGASIFYTLDGTTPTSLLGIPYTAPIAVNTPATLRTGAEKSGYRASDITRAVFT